MTHSPAWDAAPFDAGEEAARLDAETAAEREARRDQVLPHHIEQAAVRWWFARLRGGCTTAALYELADFLGAVFREARPRWDMDAGPFERAFERVTGREAPSAWREIPPAWDAAPFDAGEEAAGEEAEE